MEESRSRRAQPYTVLSDDTAYVGREDASSRSSVDVGLEKKPVHALGPQLSWKSYVADVVGILFSLFFTCELTPNNVAVISILSPPHKI